MKRTSKMSKIVRVSKRTLQFYAREMRRGERMDSRNNLRSHKKYLRAQGGCFEQSCGKKYYVEDIRQLRYLLDEAYQQMQMGQFRYALYDAGIVMREAVKMIVRHENGGDISDNLLENMRICKREKLFGTDREFINRLYEVYHICESERYGLKVEEHINHRKMYFVIMQLKDLLNFVENRLLTD